MAEQEERDRLRWEGSVAKAISSLERGQLNIESKAATKDEVQAAADIARRAEDAVAARHTDLMNAIEKSGKATRQHLDQRLEDLGLKGIGERLGQVESAVVGNVKRLDGMNTRVGTIESIRVGLILKWAGIGAGGLTVLGLVGWLIKWAVTGDPSIGVKK